MRRARVAEKLCSRPMSISKVVSNLLLLSRKKMVQMCSKAGGSSTQDREGELV